MSDLLGQLAAPFPAASVSWRVGATNGDKTKGLALAYLDSRDVQDRLDMVCGINWQVRNPWASGNKLACEIGIKIDGEWVWRGDGAGDSDVEAEKGAFSDSFKRAAVRWGIGRYLYEIKSPWVQITGQGRSYVIAEGEHAKLQALLNRSAGSQPEPARQPEAAKPATVPDEWKTLAEDLKREIDDAIDTVAVHEILESKRFTDLVKHSSKAGGYLRERATLKIGTLSQSPNNRKAA